MTWLYVDPENGTTTGVGTESDPARFLDNLTYTKGDVIHLKAGTVHRASHDVNPTADGTSVLGITFKSYGPGAAPRIDAGEVVKGFILYNSDVLTDGGLEDWSTSATPDSPWVEENSSFNDVTQETSEMYIGSSCAKLTLAEDDDCQIYQTISAGEIGDSENRRLAFAAKSSVIGGDIRVKIVRDLAGSPFYWNASSSDWVTAETWNTLSDTTTLEWQKFAFDFDTESGDSAFTFTIYIGPVTDDSNNWGTYYLDAVSCGKVPQDVTNHIEDWLFDNGTPGGARAFWDVETSDDCILSASDNERFGTYGLEFQTNEDQDETSLTHTFSAGDLTAGTYRFGLHHHKFRQTNGCDGKFGFQISRKNPSQPGRGVWTGTIWDQTDEYAMTSVDGDAYEWDFLNERFVVSDTYNYRIKVMPPGGDYGNAADKPVQYERQWCDAVSLIEDDQETDCAWAYFNQAPQMVYVSGTIDGTTYDHLQLYEDTTVDVGTSDPYPHIFGYYYDSTNKILYVNVGSDPEDCTIEASVRSSTLDLSGKSYIKVQDIDFYHAYENGLDLGFSAAVGDRPTNITVSNCTVKYAGWVGILAGQRPTDPDTTDEFPDGTGYTPANVTIEDCTVYKPNRARLQNFLCEKNGTPTDWYNGYSAPNAGIYVASGIQDTTEDGDDCGDIYVRRCELESDVPLINFSSERNGIWVATGENVYILENKVTGFDHGIYVAGGWTLISDSPQHYGDVYNFEIMGNLVYNVGDDCCWVHGCYNPGSKVCYNVFGKTGDNCIDVNKSALVEIYNNTFYGSECENECIIIWINYYNPSATGAYIYNNVFDRWGDVWRTSPAIGASKGVAIGIGPGVDTGDSIADGDTVKIDHNTYYQPSTVTDTVDYPFYIAVNDGAGGGTITRYTLSQWQALGYDVHSKVEDPKTNNADNGDFTYQADSPVFNDGIQIGKLAESVYFSDPSLLVTQYFDKEGAKIQVLSQSSSWPDAVVWEDQPKTWHKGAWGRPTATITKESIDPNFATNRTLIGVPVYAVDTTTDAQRVWKGVITSVTASVITMDGWEPLFNATGGPSGTVTYYIGYMFLYDKTPQLAFMNTWRNKTLREIELHGKRVSGSVPVYAKINVNDGSAEHVRGGTLSGDHRIRFEWTGGAHNVFQFEHAILVAQEFDMKSAIYHGSWRHGALEQ